VLYLHCFFVKHMSFFIFLKIFMERTNENGSDLRSIVAEGYRVDSCEVIEREECGLMSGDSLQVRDANGQVLYENLRAFLPLNDKMNLIRLADKVWMLVYTNKPKQVRLNRVNLHLQNGHCLLFDERGKRHMDQVSPHYRDIMA